MIKHSQVDFVFVAVIFYHEWPKIMLRSLREHFSEEVILVNHLGRSLPPEYYDNNCIILDGLQNKMTHGAGVDAAVEFLKNRGDKYFIHIEPDCLITGRDWVNGLVGAAASGAVMAGTYRLPFGPIHPCPTIWDINRIDGSFDISNRIGHVDQRIFNYRDMIRWLLDSGFNDDDIWFWCHLWDCGIKNWYKAALQGLAVHSVNSDGFRHFWGGRLRSPASLSPEDYATVEKYL